jgi:hypothetical protein
MNTDLTRALIEKKVINRKTRILAKCPVTVFGGMPGEQELFLNVDNVVWEDNNFKFIASHRNGRKFSVPTDKIMEIDGMEPTRLGLAYDIKPNGAARGGGKKRGRKPRINTMES